MVGNHQSGFDSLFESIGPRRRTALILRLQHEVGLVWIAEHTQADPRVLFQRFAQCQSLLRGGDPVSCHIQNDITHLEPGPDGQGIGIDHRDDNSGRIRGQIVLLGFFWLRVFGLGKELRRTGDVRFGTAL